MFRQVNLLPVDATERERLAVEAELIPVDSVPSETKLLPVSRSNPLPPSYVTVVCKVNPGDVKFRLLSAPAETYPWPARSSPCPFWPLTNEGSSMRVPSFPADEQSGVVVLEDVVVGGVLLRERANSHVPFNDRVPPTSVSSGRGVSVTSDRTASCPSAGGAALASSGSVVPNATPETVDSTVRRLTEASNRSGPL